MNLKLCFVIICFVLSFSANSTDSLVNIRKSFFEIKGDLSKAEELYNNGLKVENKSVVFIAYIGTLKAMLASNRSNPFSKLSWFNKGTAIIEEAVKKDFNNPEIHFLRLSIQLKSPSFLFYYGDVETDKAMVIKNLSYFKSIGIVKEVKLFLIENGNLNEEELNQIKSK